MSAQKSDLAEIVDNLETIITMQSNVINKLFLMLLQYTTVEELDNCDVVQEINKIAQLRDSKT
jgi:superfamily II helicase